MNATHDRARTSATRRTVVKAGAWSVAPVMVAAPAPAFAASACQQTHAYRLNWGSTSFTRANARSAFATVPSTTGGPTIYVTFNSISTSTLNVPDPARNLTVPGATAGADANLDPGITSLNGVAGERGIRLQHQSSTAGRTNAQEVSISFRTGSSAGPVRTVQNLRFSISDIDSLNASATVQYRDRVEISPSPTVQSRDAAITGTGLYGTAATNDPWANTNNNNNVSENQSGASVALTYASASDLLLAYWNNLNGTQYHRIFLTDFTFEVTGCV